MSSSHPTAPGSVRNGPPRGVLPVMCLALMMVVAGLAGLNNAIPDLARETGASQGQVQWIVNAYALVFSALLLPAGAIGDRYGRREVLVGGLVVFGAAAGAAMATADPGVLIALRAVMGVGAALVMPVTLSILTTELPPEERGKAVGTWVGVAGASGILGLLTSGLLLEWFDWSSVFGVNVVLALLAIAGTLAVVPRSRNAQAGALDGPGIALSCAGLALLVYGIVEGPERGWIDPLVLGSLAGGLALLAVFVLWELRAARPMLDPRAFRLPGFGMGSLAIAIQFFSAFGLFFLLMQYLQYISGYSPLEAALAMLPAPLVMMPLARVAPAVAAKLGFRLVGAVGLLVMAGGYVLMSRLDVGSGYWSLVPGLVLFGLGMALTGSPATTAIVSSVGREAQGMASAVNNTTREVGGALGIAVLGSLLNGGYRSGIDAVTGSMPAALAEKAESSIAAAQQLGRAAGARGETLVAAAQNAFVDGFGTALLVAAAVMAAGAVLVALRAPGRRAQRADAAEGDRERGLAAVL